jgi:hypothetical protein
LHVRLGALLHEHLKALDGPYMHVVRGGKPVAVFDVKHRRFHIKRGVDAQDGHGLSAQFHATSAPGFAASACELADAYELLWHFGLHSDQALSAMPESIDDAHLQLRRFPAVSPHQLDSRHMALFYLFSSAAATFAQLHAALKPEQALWLCADLAALHVTGCLAFLPAHVTATTEPQPLGPA